MIEALPLTGVALPDIQAEFEGRWRDKLRATQTATGQGREGYPDGWISEGVAIVRPYYFTSGASEGTSIEYNDLGENLVSAITQIQDVFLIQVILNAMAPGAHLDTHIDGAPYFTRWHLPIYSAGTQFIEGVGATQQVITMREGFWYGPISYWLPHSIANDTDQERVHAIVDFGPEVTL